MATTRSATTQWEGSLIERAGRVTLSSFGLGSFDERCHGDRLLALDVPDEANTSV